MEELFLEAVQVQLFSVRISKPASLMMQMRYDKNEHTFETLVTYIVKVDKNEKLYSGLCKKQF